MIIPSIYDVKRLHFLQTTSDPIGINVNSRGGGGGGPGKIFFLGLPRAPPNPPFPFLAPPFSGGFWFSLFIFPPRGGGGDTS